MPRASSSSVIAPVTGPCFHHISQKSLGAEYSAPGQTGKKRSDWISLCLWKVVNMMEDADTTMKIIVAAWNHDDGNCGQHYGPMGMTMMMMMTIVAMMTGCWWCYLDCPQGGTTSATRCSDSQRGTTSVGRRSDDMQPRPYVPTNQNPALEPHIRLTTIVNLSGRCVLSGATTTLVPSFRSIMGGTQGGDTLTCRSPSMPPKHLPLSRTG